MKIQDGQHKSDKDSIFVSGMVARRDQMPYVLVELGDEKRQLTIAQARSLAADLLRSASYAEADAQIFRFFNKQNYPEGAASALMAEFRSFRAMLAAEKVETFTQIPKADNA